jgi:hypothetical protein
MRKEKVEKEKARTYIVRSLYGGVQVDYWVRSCRLIDQAHHQISLLRGISCEDTQSWHKLLYQGSLMSRQTQLAGGS